MTPNTFCRTFAALSVLAAVCAGCGGSSNQKVILRFKPPIGKKTNYHSTISNEQTGANGTTKFNEGIDTQIVISANDEKGIKARYYVVDASATSPEKPELAPQAQAVANQMKGLIYGITFDDRAQWKDAVVAGASEKAKSTAASLAILTAGFQGIEFPEAAVGEGSTWQTRFDIGKMLGLVAPQAFESTKSSVPLIFKLTKMSSEGGKNYASVDFSMKGTMEFKVKAADITVSVATDMKGHVKVDTATGIPVETVMSGQNATTVGGATTTQKLDLTTKMMG